MESSNYPCEPGFYWALWLTAAEGTHEGDQLTPAPNWEVVQVWENFSGDPCEADRAEKFGVSVPGVREAQWLHNFKWGHAVACQTDEKHAKDFAGRDQLNRKVIPNKAENAS